MSLLEETCAQIPEIDPAVGEATQALLDVKTKPRRSLGRLEELACQLAAIRGVVRPPLPVKAILVLAADHGVAAEGVSAYPQEVTAQMLANFASGGAAINVLARQADARVVVVDMGVAETASVVGAVSGGILERRIAAGTRNLAHGPAMSLAEARAAVEAGIEIASSLAAEGVTVLGLGEMGIANSTAASALAACLMGATAGEMTGFGTGIDAAGLLKKQRVVERALALHGAGSVEPLEALARLGGFEIGGLAGAMIGAAASRVALLIDGFICSAAALLAVRLAPRVHPFLLAAHRSTEPGHARILAALGLRPLLDLELRLGEGTGAALALPLLDAAVRVLHEMATFAEAGVADTGA